jgi:hypothetical protein
MCHPERLVVGAKDLVLAFNQVEIPLVKVKVGTRLKEIQPAINVLYTPDARVARSLVIALQACFAFYEILTILTGVVELDFVT